MTITPQDIQSQQFHVRFRGFDVEEVDNFLERVAEEYLVLIEENRQLNEQIDTIKKEIDSYHLREKSFQNAIMSAQQIVEEMKLKSRREAEEILAAAQEEARQLNANANAEVAALEGDVERLKRMKTEAHQDLQQTLQRYLLLLGEGSVSGQSEVARTLANPADTMAAGEKDQPPVVDFSDLYEKIDLPDEEGSATVLGGQGRIAAREEEADGLFKMGGAEEEEIPESTVPDLEGDMLFTLEDPLDDDGPAITFDYDNDAGRQRRAG
jgi:cell division initiation protein